MWRCQRGTKIKRLRKKMTVKNKNFNMMINSRYFKFNYSNFLF